MENNYTCAICKKQHDSLDGYLACVNACGKKLKESQRIEKLNAALNQVKQAQKYFEQKLDEFKSEYPEEYELNFGSKNSKAKPDMDKTRAVTKEEWGKEQKRMKDNAISCESNGTESMKVFANVNGKEVEGNDALELLKSDPNTKYLAELLGILK